MQCELHHHSGSPSPRSWISCCSRWRDVTVALLSAVSLTESQAPNVHSYALDREVTVAFLSRALKYANGFVGLGVCLGSASGCFSALGRENVNGGGWCPPLDVLNSSPITPCPLRQGSNALAAKSRLSRGGWSTHIPSKELPLGDPCGNGNLVSQSCLPRRPLGGGSSSQSPETFRCTFQLQ